MANIMEKAEYKYFEALNEVREEITREADLIVPDYFPDVERIIKADAFPAISNVEPSKDRVLLTGTITVYVLYKPEEGQSIQCIRQIFDFDSSVNMPGVSTEGGLFSDISVGFINVRVINSRKLSIKVGADVRVAAENVGSFEVLKTGNSAIESLTESCKVFSFIGRNEGNIKVEEDIEISPANPPIGNYLYSFAEVKPTESKAIGNKVITKATLFVNTVYTRDDDGEIEFLQSEIPFTHIFELQGVDEDSKCVIGMNVKNLKTEIYENDAGENRIIACECDIRCVCSAYKEEEMDYLIDAFSTEYEYKCDRKKINICKDIEFIKVSTMIKEMVDFEKDISRIFSSSGSLNVLDTYIEDNKLIIKGNLNVSMLAMMEDGNIDSLESTLPFVISNNIEGQCEQCSIRVELNIEGLNYMIAGSNSVEIRANIGGVATIKHFGKIDALSDMVLDENKVKAKNNDYIILYYPSKDESIWEIAKKYNVKVESIKELNKCDGDICTRNMILIPKK